MNLKTHAPARREETTLQPNIHTKLAAETQYAIGLSTTNGEPRCDAAARMAIGKGLWARLCLLAAAVGSSGVVNGLYSKGEAAFVAKAGEKGPSSQVKLIPSPKQRAKPAASRTRTCTNEAVCIASGECPSRF
jgi:hypothetical protein